MISQQTYFILRIVDYLLLKQKYLYVAQVPPAKCVLKTDELFDWRLKLDFEFMLKKFTAQYTNWHLSSRTVFSGNSFPKPLVGP